MVARDVIARALDRLVAVGSSADGFDELGALTAALAIEQARLDGDGAKLELAVERLEEATAHNVGARLSRHDAFARAGAD